MLLWQLPACHPATIGYAKIRSSRKTKLPFFHWRDDLAKRCWLTIPLMRPFRGGDPPGFRPMRRGFRQVNPSQRSAIDGLKFALEKIQASSWRVKCSDCDPPEGWRFQWFSYICNKFFVSEWWLAVENKSNVYYDYSPEYPLPVCVFGMSPFTPSLEGQFKDFSKGWVVIP